MPGWQRVQTCRQWLATHCPDFTGAYTFEAPIGPPGYQRLLSENRRPFATQEGYLCVLVYSDDQWKRFSSLIEDPHLQAVGFFGQMQHPSEGLLRSIRTPTHWSCAPLDEPSPAPLLGEHTRQILAQQGYDAQAIDRLLSSGAVA